MKAVLIKGNPRFVRGDIANEYYKDIVSFTEGLGVEVVEVANIEDIPDADFYIGHARAVSKLNALGIDTDNPQLIKFGTVDGIMHPVDRDWHEHGCKGLPPKEHFIFTADQKLAIQTKVDQLKSATPEVKPNPPRQSASRRPGVR